MILNTGKNRQPDYDVALSFAGEDRAYVEQVANGLKEGNIRVFYDRFEEANLWGKDLFEYLSDVYQNRSRYTIIFVSKYYSIKDWTNHERKSAQARAISERQEYILPVRFDDTVIPGILKTTGHIDGRGKSPEQLVQLIVEKTGLKPRDNLSSTTIQKKKI